MTYAFPTAPQLLITQKWGNVNASMYPAPTYRHMGVDIGGPVGSPIYAACDGVVEDVNLMGAHGYGRHVIIRHESGAFRTLYAHLHQVFVGVGDAVMGGQKIGEMGGQPEDDDPIDGASSGSHLHFEVILPDPPSGDHVKTWAGYTVDPLVYLTRRAFGDPKGTVRVVTAKGVRVRERANVNALQIGALASLSIWPILEVVDIGNDQWARLWSLRPEYAAVRYAGEKLMEVSGWTAPVPPAADDKAARQDEVRRMIAWLESRQKELQ